jgi:hypothetical protein
LGGGERQGALNDRKPPQFEDVASSTPPQFVLNRVIRLVASAVDKRRMGLHGEYQSDAVQLANQKWCMNSQPWAVILFFLPRP